MSIIVKKENLAKVVERLAGVTTDNSTMPILKNILIKNDNGKTLHLIASDGELIGCGKVETDSKEAFDDFLIDGKLIYETLRRFIGDEVKISIAEKTIILMCGGSKVELPKLQADNFPLSPLNVKEENTVECKIPYTEFIQAVNKALVTVGINMPDKPILNCVNMEVGNSFFALISLDGFRFTLITKDIDTEYKGEKECANVNIPGTSIKKLEKLFKDVSEPLAVTLGTEYAVFNAENVKAVVRLYKGAFIDIAKLMPRPVTQIKFNRQEVLNAIELMQLIKTAAGIEVTLKVADENMVLSANTSTGNITHEVKIGQQGKDMEVAFNSLYLKEPLRLLTDDEITMYLADEMKPAMIKVEKEKEKYMYMAAPVRKTKE